MTPIRRSRRVIPFRLIVSLLATLLLSGCGPDGAGSIQVPAARSRHETARTGVLPDSNTGTASIPVGALTKPRPTRSAKGRPTKSR